MKKILTATCIFFSLNLFAASGPLDPLITNAVNKVKWDLWTEGVKEKTTSKKTLNLARKDMRIELEKALEGH